jgi:hypothetical protein
VSRAVALAKNEDLRMAASVALARDRFDWSTHIDTIKRTYLTLANISPDARSAR